MADSFTLPLRPNLEKSDRPDTLPVEIAQINEQWGGFRDVNEEVLLAKLAEEEERGGPLDSDEDGEKKEMDTTERREELYKRRAEITQFAMASHMETMFALDFISLLLSKHAPRQAETSMSAFLKQVAPIGSLNSEVVHPPPKPDSVNKDISTVSRGWRIQNFNSAANKLLGAASRLEKEVEAETKYWNSVLAIKDKGWKVCRLPRERQSLGVQYGFMEATPAFRDRGLASLRRGNDGSLVLDQGLVPSGLRFVRVRVKRGSRITGCTKPPGVSSNDAESIEQRILQARDSVFEDELFHELVREARAMASCGVTTRQNLIQIPAADGLEILLDLVDINDESLLAEQESSQDDVVLANGVAHSIRILLSFAHRQNLHRRTQVPLPLTPKRRPNPEYHLLRPALAYLQHISEARYLESFVHDIVSTLRSSGFQIPEFTAQMFSNWKLPHQHSSPSALEGLVASSLKPIESVFQGNLLAPNSSFTVRMRTNMSFPPFGTHYDVSFNLPSVPDLKSPGNLSLREEVEAAVSHLLLLDVVMKIASTQTDEEKKTEPDTPVKRWWDPIYPHMGELLLAYDHPEKHKKLRIVLSRDQLSLETCLVRCIDGIGIGAAEGRSQHTETKTWKLQQSPGIPNQQSSAMDFVTAEAST
ncbi:unnamed protein product [Penicillium pancosmium]